MPDTFRDGHKEMRGKEGIVRAVESTVAVDGGGMEGETNAGGLIQILG